MNRLCDEVLQLIFNDLDDPTALTRVSRRFHDFSQDPYIRASYFLRRYGKIQALYYAFGRGRLMNERVIDILLTSGAHLSRYLMQTAMHHYFRSFAPFIKTPWVRSMPLPVFTHLQSIATKQYGNIPVNKGEDDGSNFNEFLRESRYPAEMKRIKWDEIRDIVEKYKFIPFCNKDPIMAQFPLALAIEPRLLPLAVANGFSMDSKYRDFIFRKMFEKPTLTSEGHMDDIIKHVRELTKLDSRMFLSRTVAAEVCMEAKTNESAYKALKKLDESGDLLFELRSLVEELIKLFSNTRSITSSNTVGALTQLYHDFPSSDPTVRLVLLLGVFINDNTPQHSAIPTRLKSKLEPLGVLPITRQDIFNVLINPFVEKYQSILEFAQVEVGLKQKDIDTLVEEVATRCLEEGCKGKMLRRLYDTTRGLHDVIVNAVIQRFRLDIDDLPPSEDEDSCHSYCAPLCRDYSETVSSDGRVDGAPDNNGDAGDVRDEDGMFVDEEKHAEIAEQAQPPKSAASHDPTPELGQIGQDTLSTMIRQDESTSRSRRRFYDVYISTGETHGKLRYPPDSLHVGRWIANQFGSRSVITAIFMMHAVINENVHILSNYLGYEDSSRPSQLSTHVPVTLKHFKMLARLGRAPACILIGDIEKGAEFFFSEEDYLTPEQLNGTSEDSKRPKSSRVKVKAETQPTSLPTSAAPIVDSMSPSSSAGMGPSMFVSMKGRKRLRRWAASTVKSYAVPDSDDDAIVDEKPDELWGETKKAKQRKVESNLQRWIKHLTILQKEEQKKYKEKKKRMERNAHPGTKFRVTKSDFLKSISQSLRDLRKIDQAKRQQLYGPGVADEDYSEGEDDEYVLKTSSKGKKRKVEQHDTVDMHAPHTQH